ncbi:MAG: major intrinsic protein [Marine Group I thaumarchaeote]|nr:MAG: major intrinsic protein [Marine Group I thaumarchaeote]
MYSTKSKFLAELVGTFGLVIAATGSIVYDERLDGSLGMVFIVVVHFVGIGLLVYAFTKVSMAHFNPAVTVCLWISGFTAKKDVPVYLVAQLIGAVLGSLFVKYVIGDFADLGRNYPNYEYSIPVIFGVEVFVTVLLMIVILVVVSRNGYKISGIAVGGIIALDIFFLASVSGASMNPIRSFAPALVTGFFDDLWLYFAAPFVGSVIVGFVYRKLKSRSL